MTGRLTAALVLLGAIQVARGEAQPIVILIGGNHSDPSPAQLEGRSGRGGRSGLWRMKGDLLAHDTMEAEYFNWNGTVAGKIDQAPPPGAAEIAEVIRHRRAQRPDAPIIIVGNSWGGHTAWQVCRLLNGESLAQDNGETEEPAADESAQQSEARGGCVPNQTPAIIPVDLAIFLDPSSFGRTKDPNPSELPQNVHKAINYFTRNSFSWNQWPNEPRMSNIDLGDPKNGFASPGGPKYDSVFNWRAHVSAEWDERIHADIRQQIQAVNNQTNDSR